VADDAEQKQFRDPRVRDWLLKAKDVVVFETKDLLDEIDYELSKWEAKRAVKKVWNLSKSYFLNSSFEKEIESRMKQILDDLDDLASQIDDLGLETASDVGVESNWLGEFSRMPLSVTTWNKLNLKQKRSITKFTYLHDNWNRSLNVNDIEKWDFIPQTDHFKIQRSNKHSDKHLQIFYFNN